MAVVFSKSANVNDPVFYPFALDQIYRVKKTFTKGGSHFVEGLQLKRIGTGGYGAYDNAITYAFQSVGTETKMVWWLFENESSDLWKSCFEEV